MSELKTQLLEALDQVSDKFNKRIADIVDAEYLERLEPTLQYLQNKLEKGESVSLLDLKEMLLLHRNVIIPAVLQQEVNKLEVVKTKLAAEIK
jgi:hypothetical protein